uniref:Bifunctional DNA-directed RNA polymerase subunit beta-beta' n=1 Tax=uncultured prokaryote TaxID=198431 RepID=H5S943_9ZZZZ|nr:DNA-directed RNA polymerase subunit beta [uncultured prokaryote]
MQDLLEVQLASYKCFLEELPILLKQQIPDTIIINQDDPLEVTEVHLIEPDRPEIECLEQRLPYQYQVLLDLKVEGAPQQGVLLGRLPALTSRGTLLYGSPPVNERVAILQLRLPRVVQLARQLQKKKGLLQQEQLEKLYSQSRLIKKWKQKKKKVAIPSLQDLLNQDTSLSLDNYRVVHVGDLLKWAVRRTLQRLGRASQRLLPENNADMFLFTVLPAIFTRGVEQNLNNSGLVQWLDKTNPLAEIAHKRKITFCGLHGISNLEGNHEKIPERQIHPSHYRCICPVETPESEKVGLNLHLAADAKVDLQQNKLQAGTLSLGVSASLIPFISHNDPNRALMAAKNMKQALPLLKLDPPLVQTGWESRVGHESRCCLIADRDGEILQYCEGSDGTARELTVLYQGAQQPQTYHVAKVPGVLPGVGSFYRPPESRVVRSPFPGQIEKIQDGQITLKVSLRGSVFQQEISIPEDFSVVAQAGQQVQARQVLAFRTKFKQGDILLDGSVTVDGMLALGTNLLVAYMPWYGYNFEDALVISDRLVKEEVLTSLHLVQDKYGHYVEPRRVCLGDKLCNRHGHKGVIARIEPEERMPVVLRQDGTPLTDPQGRPFHVDLLINPHSVISRMNLGQLYETHWSWIAWKEKNPVVVPPFSRYFSWEILNEKIQKDDLLKSVLTGGKAKVRWQDPCTHHEKEIQAVVGWQYWMKVNHLSEDKLHVRATGQRTLITKQPPRGKQNEGGQRVGEMEVWALQALRAQHILSEMLTMKSDALPEASTQPMPEALRALVYYLRGLGVDLRIYVTEQEDEKLFPVEKIGHPFHPEAVVKLEAQWATDDQIEKWSSGKVITPELQALWYSCQCGHKGWSWNFAKNQKGPRRCPKCGNRQIDVSLRWHPQGLLSEAIFGEKHPQERRVRMGHIELYKPIRHPLAPERQLRIIPVIPPDYRPWSEQSEGLNLWYRRILLCDRMLRAVSQQKGSTRREPKQQKAFWRRELIRAVAGLYGKKVSFKEKEPQFHNDDISSHTNLCRLLEGKTGLIRGYILGKRVDFSGRAVIVPDPQLPFGCCRLPRKAIEKFYTNLVGSLDTLQPNAQEEALYNWCKDLLILLNRAPTLHRYNFLAFTLDPKEPFWDEPCLAVHPFICGMYNADFDGDTMAFHLPLGKEARQEAQTRLHPKHHLFSAAHGGQLLHLAQDIVSGIYVLTSTPAGCQQLGNLLKINDQDKPLDKRALQEVVERFLRNQAQNPQQVEHALQQLDHMMRMAFQRATEHGLSFSIEDLKALSVPQAQRKAKASAVCAAPKNTEEEWSHKLRKDLGNKIMGDILQGSPDNPIAILVGSGARGDAEQLARLCGAVIGFAHDFENSPFSNYVEGLTEEEYFEAAREARPDIVRKKIGPALGGDLTRKLVHGAYPLRIVSKQCTDTQGLAMPRTLFSSLRGRVSAQGIPNIIDIGQTLDSEKLQQLINNNQIAFIRVFSPYTCTAQRGICQRCYGLDPSTGRWAELGTPVGLLAAQSIGERATQDFMKAFHGIRSKTLQCIEQAKAFFEQGKTPPALEEDPISILEWLYHEAYENKVDLRHFEVILRGMQQDRLTGVVERARDRLNESFLSAMAFQAVTQHVVKAANRSLEDRCIFDPAPLFFGLGEPPQQEDENVGKPTT